MQVKRKYNGKILFNPLKAEKERKAKQNDK